MPVAYIDLPSGLAVDIKQNLVKELAEFILSPRWILHPKPIGLDGAGFRDRMLIEGLGPSMSIP
jgi:hypothetical protein